MTSVWTAQRYRATTDRGYSEIENLDYTRLCNADFHGAELTYKAILLPGHSTDPYVESGFGMWEKKIYHFKPDMPPSFAGEEIQSEFFVSYKDLPAAVLDLYEHADKFKHLILVTELRGVAEDQIPLSPAKDRYSFGIHFTWVHDFEAVYEATRVIQDVLKKYDYRVHWGKFFHARPEVFKTFGSDLQTLQDQIENQSHQKFSNCWVQRVLFDQETCNFDSNYERFADEMDEKLAAGKVF